MIWQPTWWVVFVADRYCLDMRIAMVIIDRWRDRCHSWLVTALLLVGLTGCSTPVKEAARVDGFPGDALIHDGVIDLQQTLLDRNLYLSVGGDVREDGRLSCAGVEVQAHRGSPHEPENSIRAIQRAILSGAEVVEIDAMMLRDGTWVLHHDFMTGRATGFWDGGLVRIVQMDRTDWSRLRLRDKGTGELLDIRPPTLAEGVRAFGHLAAPWQKLNVEVKSEGSARTLGRLYDIVRRQLPANQVQFSSGNLDVLQALRQQDSQVYLGFVQGPMPRSITELEKLLRRAAAADTLYSQYRRRIDRSVYLGKGYYDRRYEGSLSSQRLRDLKTVLGRNAGIHIDVRRYMAEPRPLLERARKTGLMVATYSINGAEYHRDNLLALRSAGALPDAVIVDQTPYNLCWQLEPRPEPVQRTHVPHTDLGQLAAALPADADLDRLDDQQGYVNQGLYLTLGGEIETLTERHPSARATSRPPAARSAPPSDLPPLPSDVGVRHERQGPISIDIGM